MLLLVQRWASAYMREHPNISVHYEGGGTAAGIDALISGDIDISTASRPLRPEESSALATRYQSLGLAYLVAKDALSIYVHPQNPVKNLSQSDLRKIFTGHITNWSALGGPDKKITVYTRPPNSGTQLYLKEHILNNEAYAPKAEVKTTTAAITEAVARDVGAIGFGGVAYGPSITHCAIDGIEASEENIQDGSYPLTRYLYLYTVNKPRGEVKAFIDWVLSPTGQQFVEKTGYIPLWPGQNGS